MKNSLNLCLAILFLVVLGCSCPSLKDLANRSEPATPLPTPSKTVRTPSTSDSSKGEYDLTLDKYKQLSIDQPRSEVEKILGGAGIEISSSKAGRMTFSVNKWEGEGYKSIIISFKNDKIMTKSQVGLK